MPNPNDIARECAEEIVQAIKAGFENMPSERYGSLTKHISDLIYFKLSPRLDECEKDGKRLDWLEKSEFNVEHKPKVKKGKLAKNKFNAQVIAVAVLTNGTWLTAIPNGASETTFANITARH